MRSVVGAALRCVWTAQRRAMRSAGLCGSEKNVLGPRAGSWNLYGNNVDQRLITSIMDGMVKRTRLVNGKPTSLCDLVRGFHADSTSLRQERRAVRVQGYCDVGLDDNWQSCGDKRAAPGMNYHDGVYACAHVCVARSTCAERVRHVYARAHVCVARVTRAQCVRHSGA